MGRSRGLGLLCLGQCLQLAGLSLALPYTALYLNRERGLGMGAVGLFLASAVLAAAFGNAVGGVLSDRRGRRAVMVGSLAARAALTAVLAWAVARHSGIAVLALAHWVGAFAGNLYFPAAQAWIAERYGRHERLEAFGWLRVSANLGWAVGPAVGGFLMSASYATMFSASAAVCAGVAVYLRMALPGDAPAARHPDAAECQGAWYCGLPGVDAVFGAFSGPVDRRFLRLCLWTVVMGTVMSQLVAPLSIYAVNFAGVAPGRVGLLFTVNGALVVLLQPWVSRWARGRRISAVMAGGALMYTAGYGLVGAAAGFRGLLAAMCVITLGEVAVSPGLSALAANLASPGQAGRYSGLAGFAHQLGSALGPLVGGVMLERLAPAVRFAPWAVISLLALSAAAGYRGLGRRLAAQEDGHHRLDAVPEAA